ncbi:hypothetical protein [Thermococcus sp. 21S7]|uniref:hypothetical protein n=1 Tax=Thermococcus sp. 21S7 TaxID=1638221 RepID=UPI00143974AB|nr:hypothetical protein [Thermococcus sp. 21S7]NJE61466.1 hypothetical protein [Thermococcus sp. 21S7]
MKNSSKAIFALAVLLVPVPFVDYGIAEFLLRDVPEVPGIVATPVTYGIYFPKTYAILEAGRNGEILWRAGDTLYVRTGENLSLPIVYDHSPEIQELIENRSAGIRRILETVREKKGSWNGSELYLQLSNVVWLNESERNALFSELENLGVVWVEGGECWNEMRLRYLKETETLEKELLERGYIDESDYMELKGEGETGRKRILEMRFPAEYQVEVYFLGG